MRAIHRPLRALVLCLFLHLPILPALAQSPMGKEFIVTLPSLLTTQQMNADDARFQVEVLCTRPTRVTVKWSDGSHLGSADVQGGARFLIAKPLFRLGQIMQSPEDLDVEKVNRRAWVITTDQPVMVQALFDTAYRAETYTIYPTSSYGNAYTLLNYSGYSANGDRNGAVIMAQFDNTEVKITPTVQTWSGHLAGVEYTVKLNKYQVYQVVSTFKGLGPESDLSGTVIRSNNPIGVLSFSAAAIVPTYIKAPTPNAPEYLFSAKPLVEHQLPDSYGGTTFYTIPFYRKIPSTVERVNYTKPFAVRFRQDTSRIRFMVLESPTTFTLNGARVLKRDGSGDSIFNKGKIFDFPFTGPMKVEASKPVIGMQFSYSGSDVMTYDTLIPYDTTVMVNGSPRDTTLYDTTSIPYGNPSMAWLPPVSAYRPALALSVPPLNERPAPLLIDRITVLWKQYVMITAPASAASKVRLNGAPVTFTLTHTDGNYVSAYVRVLPGLRQIIESPEPVSAMSFGLTWLDSYANTAGEAARSIASIHPDTLRFFSCDAEKDTSLMILNAGNVEFKLDSVRISGIHATIMDPASFPARYYPGLEQPLLLRFRTPQPGEYSGTIRLYTDANNQELFEIPFVITRDSARLEISGGAVDFGVLGSSATERDTFIVVRNAGTRPLTLDAGTVTGAGYELLGGSFPKTLAPGASDTLRVRFKPSGEGLREGTLRLAGRPCMSPAQIVLRGYKGGGANLLVQRTVQYGGYLCQAPAEVDSIIELRSIGDEPIVIQTAEIDGVNKEEFSLVDPLAGVTVPPGDTLRFRVRYSPGGVGSRRALLKLGTNARNGGVIDIELLARRDTAGLIAIADTVRFGQVLSCQEMLERTVTIRNTGTVADTVDAADLGGPYTLVSALPIVVQPGTEQELRVRFAPTGDGPQQSVLRLKGAPCGITANVNLLGERVTAKLSAAPVNFDTVYTCDNALLRRGVVLYNDGPVPDTVYGGTDDAGEFVLQATDFPRVLAPGERDTVEVELRAQGTGVRSGVIRFNWGPCSGTSAATSTAYVAGPSVALSAGEVDFDVVQLGGTGSARLIIRNTGTVPRRVTGVTLAPGEVRLSSPANPLLEILPGDSLVLELEYAPAALGELAGTLGLSFAEPCATDTVIALRGRAEGEEVIRTRLQVFVPIAGANVGEEVDLPIRVRDWTNATAVGATGMRIHLRYRYTLLAPQSVSTGLAGMTASLIGSRIEGEDRVVEIDIAGTGTFPANDELVRLRCLALLGDTDRTPLILDSVRLTVPANREVEIELVDGEYRTLDICRTGGDRYVTWGGVRLKPVRPNPFREGTAIEYRSEEETQVRLAVYDGFGREVAVLWDGVVGIGDHAVYFDGSRLSSGVYICELRTPKGAVRAAMVLAE